MTDQTTTATDETTGYAVSVTTQNRPGRDYTQSVSGGAKTTAAWLRALADEIDPSKPTLRAAR